MADPDVEVRGILVRPEGQTMMLDVREGGVLNIIVFEPQCEPKFGSKKIRHLGSPAPLNTLKVKRTVVVNNGFCDGYLK